jgi:hypothetical protein
MWEPAKNRAKEDIYIPNSRNDATTIGPNVRVDSSQKNAMFLRT